MNFWKAKFIKQADDQMANLISGRNKKRD